MIRIQMLMKLALGIVLFAGAFTPGQTAPSGGERRALSEAVKPVGHYWIYGEAVPTHLRNEDNVVRNLADYTLYAPLPGQKWLHLGMQFLLVDTADGRIHDLGDDSPR